jgi:DNA helicase-2/ATP-dependent DNA helicase PcrA
VAEIEKVRTLLGPPGTGKTTAILDQIDGLLADGVPPQQIAFVSYTTAAVKNAIDRASSRFDLDPDSFVYFRTIHAMGLLSMRGHGADKPKVMGASEWKAFGESFSYDFTDDGGDEPTLNFAEDGDCLKSLTELRRVKRCSTEEAILHASEVPPHIESSMVDLFASRLAAWKRDNGQIDFTDMLERSLASAWRPPVRFAFIDEAQDNSRLQNALTVHWFWHNTRCELVTYAGDDDQAIYDWSGGDIGALVRLASKTECRVLEQSYRVPKMAHALAESIVRQNKNRVPKSYRPRDEDGSITIASGPEDAVSACPDGAAILARNIMFLHPHRKALIEHGRLFSCEAGPAAPLDRKDTLGAFRAICAWRRGASATAADLMSLLALVPSKLGSQVIVPRGIKTRAKENEDPVPVWRAREQFKLNVVLGAALRESGMFDLLTRVAPEERRYLEIVLARDPLLQRAKVVATTDHRSKGREFPCVVVDPNMANRSHRSFTSGRTEKIEEENRVQYVASTRTKGGIIIERPSDYRHYPYDHHIRSARAAWQ